MDAPGPGDPSGLDHRGGHQPAEEPGHQDPGEPARVAEPVRHTEQHPGEDRDGPPGGQPGQALAEGHPEDHLLDTGVDHRDPDRPRQGGKDCPERGSGPGLRPDHDGRDRRRDHGERQAHPSPVRSGVGKDSQPGRGLAQVAHPKVLPRIDRFPRQQPQHPDRHQGRCSHHDRRRLVAQVHRDHPVAVGLSLGTRAGPPAQPQQARTGQGDHRHDHPRDHGASPIAAAATTTRSGRARHRL